MMAEHDALRDLIAPVALGAAEPREIARVEAHAAECAVCREELMSMRATADALAVAVPQLEPSTDLKASLMSTVRAEAPARAEAAGVTGVHAAPAPATTSRRSWLPGWLMRPWPAMAALAVVAALVVGVVAIQNDTGGPGGDGSTAIALTGTADAPGVTGRVVYVPDEDTAVVTLSRVPELDPGDAYQLWIIREGQDPQSAGLFDETGPGQVRTVVTGLAGGDALAVTAQPRTSRVTPKLPILVQAQLQNG